MEACVKCKICGEQLYYSPSSVNTLGEHLIRKHPDNPAIHFSSHEHGPTRKGTYTSKFVWSDDPRVFKTTVETWHSAPTEITCPCCGEKTQPLIRKQRNKIASTSFGALCLLGCWPLCFLPFMLGGSEIINLYCRNCCIFLGRYNKKTRTFIPLEHYPKTHNNRNNSIKSMRKMSDEDPRMNSNNCNRNPSSATYRVTISSDEIELGNTGSDSK